MREPLKMYFRSVQEGPGVQGEPFYLAADVEALLRDLVRKWKAQTGAREGVTFRLAMKEIQAFLDILPKAQL